MKVVNKVTSSDGTSIALGRAGRGVGAQFAIAAGHQFVKPFDLGGDPLAACGAQLLHRGPFGLD